MSSFGVGKKNNKSARNPCQALSNVRIGDTNTGLNSFLGPMSSSLVQPRGVLTQGERTDLHEGAKISDESADLAKLAILSPGPGGPNYCSLALG
jgi:hypothetical protein